MRPALRDVGREPARHQERCSERAAERAVAFSHEHAYNPGAWVIKRRYDAATVPLRSHT